MLSAAFSETLVTMIRVVSFYATDQLLQSRTEPETEMEIVSPSLIRNEAAS